MTKFLLPVAALVLVGTVSSQATRPTGTNPKLIYNTPHSTLLTRVSVADARLYYMQPQEGLTGYSSFRGWTFAASDLDYQTSNTLALGVSAYAKDKLKPDVSSSGTLVSTNINSLSFPKPANGTQSNIVWTIWLNNVSTAKLPENFGYSMNTGVGKITNNQWTDGMFVYTQNDRANHASRIRIPTAKRRQWTWYTSATATSPLAYYEKGSSIWLGGLFTEPMHRAVVSSTVYSSTAEEDLAGPDALWPDSTKDKVRWEIFADEHKNGVGVILIGAARGPKVIPSPFGSLFMLPPFGLVQIPLVLDKDGHALTGAVPVQKGMKYMTQSAAVNLKTGKIRVSDLFSVEVL